MIDLSPVVATGFGVVHAGGCGRESAREAFAVSEHVPWTEVDRSEGYHRTRGARSAGLARHNLKTWIPPIKARRMSGPSKISVAATRMALEDAGLEVDAFIAENAPTTGVYVSNSYGPSAWMEKIFDQIRDDGPTAVSPALFTETVSNAPAAQIALLLKARGPNLTVTQRDAGGWIAVVQAATEIVLGRIDRAVVVAVDEITPLLHSILERFGALAEPDEEGRETPRPFDLRRSGFLLAEGASALLLERADAVAARGSAARLRLRAGASAFDPHAPVAGWSGDAEPSAGSLRRFLQQAGVAPEQISAIVSSASGSRDGDAQEARILRALFGERALPPILTPKAFLGDFGGAQTTALMLAAEGARFAATPGFEEIDPELGVIPHAGGIVDSRMLLGVSAAPGGAASWLLAEGGEA